MSEQWPSCASCARGTRPSLGIGRSLRRDMEFLRRSGANQTTFYPQMTSPVQGAAGLAGEVEDHIHVEGVEAPGHLLQAHRCVCAPGSGPHRR